MQKTIDQLARMLGPKGWLSGEATAPYRRDWLDRCGRQPLGVARPASVDEVAATVSLCSEAGIAIVPQGGNTGLCCAAVTDTDRAIILSLSRMNRIGEPDLASGTLEVEAGAVLASVHDALARHELIFPLHLGAEGSAQIGGLIGTNAGGSHALRYGMMQDLVVGLEVVVPDGSVWDGMRAVQKDNAGYQLRRLFCGAEGTLGIVTRAVLRVHPAPRQRTTALLAMPDFSAAVEFGALARRSAGEFISGLEFFGDQGLAFALKHIPALQYPLAERSDAYVLIELTCSSSLVPLDEIATAILEEGMEHALVLDGALAMSEQQRAAFWRLREELPEGQRLEGGQLKHDISVPPGKVAVFIDEGAAICEAMLPHARINPFGHLGDGNIHFNISPPPGADFGGKAGDIAEALAALATRMGGSFAAEHGLGRTKVALADAIRSPVERDLMRRMKAALDPGNLFNPGVLVTPQGSKE